MSHDNLPSTTPGVDLSRQIVDLESCPPSTQQRRGLGFGQLDRAVGGHAPDRPAKRLEVADAAWGAQANHRAGHLPAADLLGPLPVELEDPGIGARDIADLEPVEHLRRRVDLVVVAAVGKDRHLVQILRQPRRLLRHPDKAVVIIAVCACMRMTLSNCGL